MGMIDRAMIVDPLSYSVRRSLALQLIKNRQFDESLKADEQGNRRHAKNGRSGNQDGSERT